MKTAIIYSSKHGTTEKVAAIIADKLKESNEVELFSLNKNANPDINAFESVIIGSPIYAGQASKKVKNFCVTNESLLLQKKIGLFVCGMEPTPEKREQELKDAYSEELFKNAVSTGFLGGAFIFEQMNFFERLIIKKIAKTDKSVQKIETEAVVNFIKNLL